LTAMQDICVGGGPASCRGPPGRCNWLPYWRQLKLCLGPPHCFLARYTTCRTCARRCSRSSTSLHKQVHAAAHGHSQQVHSVAAWWMLPEGTGGWCIVLCCCWVLIESAASKSRRAAGCRVCRYKVLPTYTAARCCHVTCLRRGSCSLGPPTCRQQHPPASCKAEALLRK
jgi:hypothetical protein